MSDGARETEAQLVRCCDCAHARVEDRGRAWRCRIERDNGHPGRTGPDHVGALYLSVPGRGRQLANCLTRWHRCAHYEGMDD